MNDPHVKSLHYRLIPGDSVDYERAEPITVETPDFVMKVGATEATFEMKTHYTTKDEAKARVDSWLRCWEVLVGLEHDPGDLSFSFQRADVIDRAPSETNAKIVNADVHFHIDITTDAAAHVSRGKYPSSPRNFALSPDVETMYIRYKAYREGRESLLSMAYMCLTVLEASAGGRPDAATKYCIAKPVLDKLGTLCSERGDPQEARKNPKSGTFVALSNTEKEWITMVIKALIRRAGECAHDPKAPFLQLTVNDFPKL